jgi:hypothetical protein
MLLGNAPEKPCPFRGSGVSRTLQQTVDHLPFERFCQEQGVFGDPAECIDRLQAARDEFGLCQIICWFDQGCRLPIAEVKRAMAQFADQVMPKV